jgi:hypothetical protein
VLGGVAHNRATVEPIAKALMMLGGSVFWDPDLIPGQNFDRVIAARRSRTSLRRTSAAVTPC